MNNIKKWAKEHKSDIIFVSLYVIFMATVLYFVD